MKWKIIADLQSMNYTIISLLRTAKYILELFPPEVHKASMWQCEYHFNTKQSSTKVHKRERAREKEHFTLSNYLYLQFILITLTIQLLHIYLVLTTYLQRSYMVKLKNRTTLAN